jgi:hypothetical protein
MTAFSTTISTFALSLFIGRIAVGGLPIGSSPPDASPGSATSNTGPAVAPAIPFSLAISVPGDAPPLFSPRPPVSQKSADSPSPSEPQSIRKRPLLAAAEVAGLNLGVWAVLHYVGNAFYSYISWETISDNLRDGWEWDRSRYFVNFYHHPYHGYLYFSAGRANGLGYWGSALAAFGGSLMWEMIMEKYRPSINDLITTTAGGCVYGEIGFRFSALVRKKEARGLGRIWREAVGTVLDPVGGVNRLLNGRKDSDPSLPGSPDAGRILNGELVLTGPVLVRTTELLGTRAAPLLGFTLNYGDPAGTGWSGHPYDVFSVKGRLRWGPDRPHLSLFIHGALFGKKLASHNGDSHFLGFYQHYEYYGFDTLRVSGTSFTGGWASRFEFKPSVRLTTGVRLGWLGLGASDDFYADPGDRRAYNLGTGWTAAAEAAIAVKGFEYFSAIWRHYGLFNLNVIGSRPGRESWNIIQVQVAVPVWSKLGLGFVVEYCGRYYDFEDYEPGSRRLVEARAYAAWQF